MRDDRLRRCGRAPTIRTGRPASMRRADGDRAEESRNVGSVRSRVTGTPASTAVVPADRVLDTALDLARRFRTLGPRAVEQSKAAVHMCGETDLGTARRIGLEALAMLIDGPEWQEGMAAFMQKRPPVFPDRA